MTQQPYKTVFNQLSDIKNYVGQEVGLSEWFKIDQTRIDNFADVTEDHQWIHINPEMAAKHSPYKTTIAHGFLVLSMAPKISYETMKLDNVAMGVNYGLNKVRFISGTPSGAFVRGRVSVKEYKEIPGGARYILDIVFELKGSEKPACVAEWIGQAYNAPAGSKATPTPTETPKATTPKNEAVLYEKQGKVAVITLNRPKRYNAINDDLLVGLADALGKARNDDSIRAVVLTGNGKGFCAGADMEGFTAVGDTREVSDYLNTAYGTVIRRLVEMPKPVIGCINGPAAGAGLGIVLACDFRVMAETANMRWAFINIGLVPDAGASWLLSRTVGYSKALEIATEGEKISSAECHRLGLTNKVAAPEALLSTTMTWANRLAERPTKGFAGTKKAMHFGMNNDLFASIAVEAEEQVKALQTVDHQEGVLAFLQKRKPKFIGR